MKITKKDFGLGTHLYILENDYNVKLSVTDFGARIVEWWLPTTAGEKNVVLGFDSAGKYQTVDTYLGATIGRVAGRITGGKFTIENTPYQVTTQPDQHNNTLHGGPNSFETKIWKAELIENKEDVQVIFSYDSPNEENGFPGNMSIKVTYTLTNDNEWRIDYQATTDAATLFNPTNHVYFNLTGNQQETIHEHYLQLASEQFAVINSDVTATGEKRAVDGTPFDFRETAKIKQIFETDYSQNTLVGGLDHPFFLDTQAPVQATLTSPDGQIAIEMRTSEEAVVIFSGNFGPEIPGKEKIKNFTGITLETQASPGAIEFENFGNIILKPGETYYSNTLFKAKFN